ncbi:MAG: Nal1-like putative serine protease [Candidatus Krumholzibacteriia bacterium]
MAQLRLRRSVILSGLLAVLAISSLVFTGCGRDQETVIAPQTTASEAKALAPTNPTLTAAIAVQERNTPALMAMPDVVGTAVGATEDGQPAILVLTVRPLGEGRLPADLDGLPVREFVTGVIKPMKPTSTTHTAKQVPPIQLGTSGGWRYDLANGYCCGGTLGSLLTDGTNQYILSNTHVFAMDIVLGGNNLVAAIGDPVIQPGLIDVGCVATNAQDVATLYTLASLPTANVDAAIAKTITGMVRTDGAILEIGTLSKSTVAAYVGQLVKKSGRTTGLTRSNVTGLNGTVSITYETECAGTTAFTKTFTGQLIMANLASKFLNSGDSGSLMVEDIATNPRAVGLLFAGSSSSAIANPINEVLAWFGPNFTMVGY